MRQKLGRDRDVTTTDAPLCALSDRYAAQGITATPALIAEAESVLRRLAPHFPSAPSSVSAPSAGGRCG